MDPTNARKTVILAWIFVLIVLFVGGVSSGDHLPSPKKFFGASVAYLGLAVAADFAAPVVVAFSFAFGFYILLQNTGSLTGLDKLTSPGTDQVVNNGNTGQALAGHPQVNNNSPAATKF